MHRENRLRSLVAGLLVLAAPLAQAAVTFVLSVEAADDQGRIEQRFAYDAAGCQGDNLRPAMRWHGAPADTRGFAITVYDPDAKGGWWHWLVLDIPPAVQALDEEASLPDASLVLQNSFGHARWDGPCPPTADAAHHYVFTVYALDTDALALPANAEPEQARAMLQRHALATASVSYVYGR